ncbi:hypothetical protein ACTFIU_002986 [Dictyostelium citrinum]
MFQKFSSTFDDEDSATTSEISIDSSIIKDGEIAATTMTTVAPSSTNSSFTTIPFIDSDPLSSTSSIKNPKLFYSNTKKNLLLSSVIKSSNLDPIKLILRK